jgi:hypothetical protein
MGAQTPPGRLLTTQVMGKPLVLTGSMLTADPETVTA